MNIRWTKLEPAIDGTYWFSYVRRDGIRETWLCRCRLGGILEPVDCDDTYTVDDFGTDIRYSANRAEFPQFADS